MELTAALDRLNRVLNRFHELDRLSLGPVQAEAAKDPKLRNVAGLVARARTHVRQAGEGAAVARAAGSDWLARHGSQDAGGSGAWRFEGDSQKGGSGAASFGTSAVKEAWGERIPTPGGMAYYPSRERSLREAAAALPPFPGEYTFDAHGRSNCAEFDNRKLNASEIAQLIRADGRWGGRPVRLFSCNTGRGDDPVAGELANLLGVRVIAPDDFAWSAADGWVGVAPIKVMKVGEEVVEVPDRDHEGSWRVFDPMPGSSEEDG